MGLVYRTRQLNLNREVALKMILAGSIAGPEERLWFLAEGGRLRWSSRSAPRRRAIGWAGSLPGSEE
jgi:hypothetical protein